MYDPIGNHCNHSYSHSWNPEIACPSSVIMWAGFLPGLAGKKALSNCLWALPLRMELGGDGSRRASTWYFLLIILLSKTLPKCCRHAIATFCIAFQLRPIEHHLILVHITRLLSPDFWFCKDFRFWNQFLKVLCTNATLKYFNLLKNLKWREIMAD